MRRRNLRGCGCDVQRSALPQGLLQPRKLAPLRCDRFPAALAGAPPDGVHNDPGDVHVHAAQPGDEPDGLRPGQCGGPRDCDEGHAVAVREQCTEAADAL